MSGAGAKKQSRPLIALRARLRPKAQLTLPEEIRQALRISEGDEIEFAVHEDGTITARGFVSVPRDQAPYFAPESRARQPSEQVVPGGEVHASTEATFPQA